MNKLTFRLEDKHDHKKEAKLERYLLVYNKCDNHIYLVQLIGEDVLSEGGGIKVQ